MGWVNALSSTVFLTNAWAAKASGERLYAILFLILVLTSWLAHGSEAPAFIAVDKIAVYSVVVYGGYLTWRKRYQANAFHMFVVVFTFFATVFLFHYGGCTGTMCYDRDFGKWYHALLHGFGSVGHHSILLL